VRIFEDGQEKVIWTSREHFEKIKRNRLNQNPGGILIPYGRLETILAEKSEARAALVWKNFYFGRKRKKSIRWKAGAYYSSPAHVIAPEIFSELEKLVDFSRPVREYFQSQGQHKSEKMPTEFFQFSRLILKSG
jgi:hypothetical protein